MGLIKQSFTIKIIRWAMKQLALIINEHPNMSYADNEKLGIEDWEYIPEYKEYRIDIRSFKK
jgi:hypothetical protein